MRLFGSGVDIVEVQRVKRLINKGNVYKKRVFSKGEIKYCDNKKNSFNFFAKRFAAKEAFSKSLGTGFSKGLKFNEIEVYNNKLGKPQIRILGNSQKIVNRIIKGSYRILLSLSDETKCVIAFVIIEKNEKN
tara:strand:- start:295 stop:690 length:396 start_codon:yes stop_codon:yes gene_type:complete